MGGRALLALCVALAVLCVSGQPSWSWDKDAPDGPEHWAEQFPACGGEEQSPVDIRLSEAIRQNATRQLVQKYPRFVGTMVNNGHNWEVETPEDAALTLKGGPLSEEYRLVQFHFHSPSEHKIDSAKGDAELHLVHRSKSGKRAVVAVIFVAGSHRDASPLLSTFLDAAAKVPFAGNKTTLTVDLQDELPVFRHYFHYRGSLTTPPCTEGVDWLVQATGILASPSQLQQLRALMGKDRRPTQPLNRRTITLYSAEPIQKAPKIRTNSTQFIILVCIGVGAIAASLAYCLFSKRRRESERQTLQGVVNATNYGSVEP